MARSTNTTMVAHAGENTHGVAAGIAARNYSASDAEVTALAAGVAAGVAAAGTYLRVLVAALQARLGVGRPGRRRASIDALGALEAEHTRLYALVMSGVGPPDLDNAERVRRATFARSAASTVRAFIGGGGDARTLDLSVVSKAGLRAAVAPPESEDRTLRSAQRAEAAIIRAVERLVGKDAEAAEELVVRLTERLEQILGPVVPEGTQAESVVLPAKAPRGAPAGAILHKGA